MNKKEKLSLSSSFVTAAIVTAVIEAVYIFACIWSGKPAITVQSDGFMGMLLFGFIIAAICFSVAWYNTEEKPETYASLIFWIAAGAVVVFFIINGFVSGSAFHAKKYSKIIKVEQGDEKDIPSSTDMNRLFLTDTKSARKLCQRVLGSESDYASQYTIGELTQIVYQGKTVKVAPLEYDGFFKWNSNRKSGVPAYVMIENDSEGKPYATLVKLDKNKGMKYVPSAAFGEQLARYLYNNYPSKIFAGSHFELDEKGNPYFVSPYYGKNVGISGAKTIKGAVVVDPCTGKMTDYKAGKIPEWIDLVVDGDNIAKMYNWYGTLRNGFWNSVVGQKGCIETTDDFGYVSDGTDIWSYSGVTSVTGDSSNLGFILANERTGEAKYIKCDGADEKSAMKAAEGEVQEKKYTASFPSLITIDGQPTYILVLKDKNLLTKDYALVNVKRYDQIAIGVTPDAAFESYKKLLKGEITAEEAASESESVSEPERKAEKADTSDFRAKKITAGSVKYVDIDGNTYICIKDRDGNIYKSSDLSDIMTDITEGEDITIYTNGERFSFSR